MIVWELFGLWAFGCLAWENRRAIVPATICAALFMLIYTTGTVIFGSWWFLVIFFLAPIAYQFFFASFAVFVTEVMAFGLIVITAGFCGTIWEAMDGLAQVMK